MVPPDPAEPVPVTVSPPSVPVLLRIMPLEELLAALPDEILRKVNPAAPMVVLVTFKAVPAVVERVLTMLVLFCVAVTVPPPVAAKESFAPVLRLSPAVKLMALPLLLVSEIPVPVSLIAPVKLTVPPVLVVTATERPVA